MAFSATVTTICGSNLSGKHSSVLGGRYELLTARCFIVCMCACAGAEQLVGGVCVSGRAPCDDGDKCTVDQCDEQFGACFHQLSNSSTLDCTPAVCGGPRCVPLCPHNSECGSDGWSAHTIAVNAPL